MSTLPSSSITKVDLKTKPVSADDIHTAQLRDELIFQEL